MVVEEILDQSSLSLAATPRASPTRTRTALSHATHAMRSTQVASLSNSARLFARRPTSFSSAKDPLDMTNMVGPDAAAFDFPLTRPTVLKMEKQRKILHYLRLEQLQFKDLGQFEQSTRSTSLPSS